MNPGSSTRISCERPLDSAFADRIESALADPAIMTLLIEFRCRAETETSEVDQILADDRLIGRLRTLIRQMEQSPKAVAALVFESIGGLQLEVALACHVRFSGPGTICLDFPWLKYGLMPILGGTQRLPRLCGIEWAARLLLEAEKMSLPDAAEVGLLVVKDHSLPEAALAWADANPKPGQPWDRVPQELSLSYSQRALNRQLFEKIYLKLRRRLTPEEAGANAILRCLQDGLER